MNYYNEWDKKTAAWLRELIKAGLIPKGEVDERSITDVQPGDLRGFTQCHFFAGIGGWSYALRLAGWPEDEPVWTGSCPCQPFSNSGSKLGEKDSRHLWPFFRELIRNQKPSTIFGEQVASEAGRSWLANVFSDLEGMAYEPAGADLCAASVGADHNRPRLWWVADINGKRRQKQREHWNNSINCETPGFREANRLVDAFQREALPFLCRWHDGIPERVGRVAIKGLGNAIVPQVAAEFIGAYMDVLEEADATIKRISEHRNETR